MEHLDNQTLLKVLVDKRIAAERLTRSAHLIGRDLSLVEGTHEAFEATLKAASAAEREADQAERILLKRFRNQEKEGN